MVVETERAVGNLESDFRLLTFLPGTAPLRDFDPWPVPWPVLCHSASLGVI